MYFLMMSSMSPQKNYLLGGNSYCRFFDVFVEFSANSKTTKEHRLYSLLPISICLACVCVCVCVCVSAQMKY